MVLLWLNLSCSFLKIHIRMQILICSSLLQPSIFSKYSFLKLNVNYNALWFWLENWGLDSQTLESACTCSSFPVKIQVLYWSRLIKVSGHFQILHLVTISNRGLQERTDYQNAFRVIPKFSVFLVKC